METNYGRIFNLDFIVFKTKFVNVFDLVKGVSGRCLFSMNVTKAFLRFSSGSIFVAPNIIIYFWK